MGPKRDANGEWKRLHNEKLHSLYHSPNSQIEMGRSCSQREEGSSAFKILTAKSTGKRPLGRPRHGWEDNIRMELEEIGINVRNWADLAQDENYWRSLVNNAALNLRVS